MACSLLLLLYMNFIEGWMQKLNTLLQVQELEARVLGKGVFQRFLETHMGPTSQARRACCSAEFLDAASSITK